MSFLSSIGKALGKTWQVFGDAVSSVPIIGPAAGSAVSSIGDILANEDAKDQLQDERNWNAVQTDINRDWQEKMWNKNNEYNSPVEQMKRLAQAGINPNAAFGSSGYNFTSSSAPNGAQPAPSPSLAAQMLLQSASLNQMRAQTRKANADANIQEQAYSYNNATYEDRVKALGLANDETQARIDKLIADKDIQQKTFEIMARKSEEELREIQERVNLLMAQIEETEKRTVLTDTNIQGAKINNAIEAQKLEFAKITGFPVGMDATEAAFGLARKGEFGSLVDMVVGTVEEVQHKAVGHARKWADRFGRDVFGDDAVDFVEDAYHDLRKGIRRFFTVKSPRAEYLYYDD